MKEKQEPTTHRKTTLQELGPTLPVIPKQFKGAKNFNFSFCDWDMKVEEKLAERQKKSRNTGKFVNSMFSEVLAELCGIDFQGLGEGEQALKINQLEFPNILYIYIYLRVEELGNELKFNPFPCPHPLCGQLIENFMADLNQLDVNVKWKMEDGKVVELDREIKYDLFKPITLDDGKIITGLKLDVSKWEFMENAKKDDENAGSMKRMMFESSICGAYDAKGPIETFVDVPTVVRRLKKRDIELCIKRTVENNGGPEIAMEGECPHCHSKFYKQIDWRYDSFFDSSSL